MGVTRSLNSRAGGTDWTEYLLLNRCSINARYWQNQEAQDLHENSSGSLQSAAVGDGHAVEKTTSLGPVTHRGWE